MGALVAAAGCALAAPASAQGDKPDLVPLLPTRVDATQVAPVYVDAFSLPGRLLYRFDAVIANRGGALDLWGNPAAGVVYQVVWRGGSPALSPDPNYFAPHPGATVQDRTALGARLAYVTHGGHDHWHLLQAARYELLVPGEASRESKAGFCLVDTYELPSSGVLFPFDYLGVGPSTWCKAGEPNARFVRMGLSPSAGDRYRAQVVDQWVDVTGLAAGPYTLTATVNPLGYIDEVERANNVLAETRVVPGVRARSFAVQAVAGRPAEIDLSGTVVGPEIPARASAACQPSPTTDACYARTSASGPLSFRVETPPAHGSIDVGAGSGLGTTAVYTPARGYSGGDAFTYVAADTRGLTSSPARVEVRVVPAAVCVVPRLRGVRLAAARGALRRARCRLGETRFRRSPELRGRVLSQRPRAGTRLPAGGAVDVVVGR